MPQGFRSQLLAAFDLEQREHLAAIRAALGRGGEVSAAELRDAFRRAHSLKGAARAVDLPAVEEVAHRAEALFAAVIAGERSLDEALRRAIAEGLDAIEAYAAALKANEPLPDLSAANRALGALDTAAPSPQPPEVPAAEEAPERPAGVEDAEEEGQEPQAAYLTVSQERIDGLSTAMHGLSAVLQGRQARGGELADIRAGLRAMERRCETLSLGLRALVPAGGDGRETDPQAAKLYAGLRDLSLDVQRLGRTVANLERDERHASWTLDQALVRLRREVLDISLVPIETVFAGFGHMVRSLAQESGREVEFGAEGLDLRAGRSLLQALKDPVLHVLRNAVGHGSQPPQERQAQGKPSQGEVALICRVESGRLVVTVRDDGAGPDLARIEETAVARGLLPPRRAGEPAPSADRLLALVFEAGFSTATAVDRISGRGMGLSVVAEAVRRLQGTVLMRPGPVWGTEVVISVPVSAALQPMVLVEAGGRSFGLPSHGVERLLRIDRDALESVDGRPAARIAIGGRDVTVPVLALSSLIASADEALPVEGGFVKAVLLRRGDRRCAVAVESLSDMQTMTVQDVEGFGLDRTIVSGAVVLEDGVPALVLDTDGLVARWLERDRVDAGRSIGLVPPPKARQKKTILVVDDSITTRTLQKSILESQGYRVLLSVDGVDALETLRSGQALIDLVIADVEMPRMDGFGLVQAIKNDPRLSSLPVVLMTSRAAPEDIRRGLELGAEAYLTKQKFDQRELLATIGQLV